MDGESNPSDNCTLSLFIALMVSCLNFQPESLLYEWWKLKDNLYPPRSDDGEMTLWHTLVDVCICFGLICFYVYDMGVCSVPLDPNVIMKMSAHKVHVRARNRRKHEVFRAGGMRSANLNRIFYSKHLLANNSIMRKKSFLLYNM